MLKIREIPEDEFLRMGSRWNDLLDISSSKNIFLTWEWLSTWWKYFGGGQKVLCVLGAWDRTGELVAVAPFYREPVRGVLRVERIRFLGSQKVSSEYLDCIVRLGMEREAIEGFVDHLFRRIPVPVRVEWTDMSAESVNVTLIERTLEDYGIPYVRKEAEVCPFLPLNGNLPDFDKSIGPKNFRRKRRVFQRDFGNTPRVIDSAEEVEGAFTSLYRLHGSRWATKGKKGNFVDSNVRRFHSEVGKKFLEKGWLRFYLLDGKDGPIAALYCFAYGGKTSYFQSGFDPLYGKWSPGLILVGTAIEDAIANRQKEFDFLRGTEEYKKRWTKERRETVHLVAFPPTRRGHIERFFFKAKMNLKRDIKRYLKKWQ